MQQRRGTAAQWISTNSGNGPILAAGEIGFESDTNKFKIGDGVNHWVDLTYFTDAASAIDAITDLVDGAPDLLNTLGEIAAALGDDPAFFTTIGTDLSDHTSATTNVHGILDTDELATKEYVTTEIGNSEVDQAALAGSGLTWDAGNEQFAVDTTLIQERISGVSDEQIGYLSGVTSDIQTQIDAKLESADLAEAAQDAVDTAIVAGTGIEKTYDDLGNTITINVDSTIATTSYADDAADAADTSARGYADSLASNYDASGAASTAETNANNYTDTSIGNLGGNVTAVVNGHLDVMTGTGIAVNNNAIEVDFQTLGSTYDALGAADTAYTNATLYTDNAISDLNLATTYDAYGAAATVAGNLTTHESDTTAHGTTGDVVGTSDIQTLTNKTLTSPVINTPTGITKSDVGLANVDNTSDEDKPVSTATQTALDAKLALAGGTMTGAITLAANPSSALHAATKQYVDNTAAGIIAKPQVLGATTANVDATYDNGTAGVGATLTHNTNGAFPAEAGGASGWAVGKGILVKNQTNKAENGRYFISDMGSPSTPYVLTRCGYCDEADEIPGAYIFVQDGTSAGTGWIQVVADPATFVVGTDNIDVYQFSGSGTITAGTNISVSGNQVSTVSDPTFTSLTVGDVSNTEIGYLNGVTSAIQTQLDGKQAVVSGVSDTEIGYLDGVTSSIQTQINEKQDVVSGVSSTEIGYLDGVTSSIQTQINAKAPTANPTFTGTVAGVTKSMVGLGNVDNTADADKPVSTATQTALDLKADLAGATFTGTVDFTGATVNGISSYEAPTLGSTSIASGATVTTVEDLNLINPILTVNSVTNTFVAVAGGHSTNTNAASSTDGITWTPSTLPVEDGWTSVAYGNNTFVAVAGYYGNAASSTDGITWTLRTLPASDYWYSVAYGSNTFVAVVYGSTTAATSTDGITWTARTLPASASWDTVAYGNNTFVAVTYGSTTAASSTDGITWTLRTLPANNNWEAVTYGNNIFVAVAGDSTAAASSTDGITWTLRTLPTSADWRAVAYGSNTFVAIGYYSTTAASSTDGITWTERTLPTSPYWNSITFGLNTFVAVARYSDTAATSTDGITWTLRTMPLVHWSAVTFGSSSISSNGTPGQVLKSTGDGVEWGTVDVPPASTFHTVFAMV